MTIYSLFIAKSFHYWIFTSDRLQQHEKRGGCGVCSGFLEGGSLSLPSLGENGVERSVWNLS